MITGCSKIISTPYFIFKDSVSMLKTAEMLTGFWWGNLRGRDHFEDLSIDGRIILKGVFNKWYRVLTGLIWLRIGKGGGAVVNAVMNLQVP